jgi:glyoxylase-like metal-dependent hydrolase (beta-lactamase superfamily II)
MANPLSVGMFNRGYLPVPGGPGWDDRTPARWPASTSTLISGGRDAILVDAPVTTEAGERPAAWVRGSGERPQAVFVTHGHADHFFGASPGAGRLPRRGADRLRTGDRRRGPGPDPAPDDDATGVLDQSRRYIEDFDDVVAMSGTSAQVYDDMVARCPDYGNRFALFTATATQFPS